MNRFLGKLLFPRQPRDVQRRKANIVLMVLLVGLFLGGLIALMLVYRNKMGVR
jgi:LPS O-antigen subunit length determinant protein (WzzB/FepE family)